jgi:hypothetical protein
MRIQLAILSFLCLSLITIAETNKLENLNIKFKLRGYCYAGSISNKSDIGGFGKSKNMPVDFPAYYKPKDQQVKLIAFTNQKKTFNNKYLGFTLILANSTTKDALYEGCDSRMSIIMQAKNEKGEWQNIEYLPSSWCGNSYHTITLPKNKAWVFSAPKYHGNYKTQLRFKFGQIFSNVFEGSINKEQFSVKRRYHSNNLMDPYKD